MIQQVGDPDVCAKHGCKLEAALYMGSEVVSRLCPQCHFSGSCPTHPQAGVWMYNGPTLEESGERCAICGYWFDGRDPPPDQAVVIRSFAKYRTEASRTDGTFPPMYYAGGLCEEAGELWRIVKRACYHQHEWAAREEIVAEVGDALWLLDQLAKHLGVTLEEAATANIAKLRERYPNGWSPEASRNRKGGI